MPFAPLLNRRQVFSICIGFHHHGEADHLAYLERPFLQAREAIHRRMHQLGVPH